MNTSYFILSLFILAPKYIIFYTSLFILEWKGDANTCPLALVCGANWPPAAGSSPAQCCRRKCPASSTHQALREGSRSRTRFAASPLPPTHGGLGLAVAADMASPHPQSDKPGAHQPTGARHLAREATVTVGRVGPSLCPRCPRASQARASRQWWRNHRSPFFFFSFSSRRGKGRASVNGIWLDVLQS